MDKQEIVNQLFHSDLDMWDAYDSNAEGFTYNPTVKQMLAEWSEIIMIKSAA